MWQWLAKYHRIQLVRPTFNLLQTGFIRWIGCRGCGLGGHAGAAFCLLPLFPRCICSADHICCCRTKETEVNLITLYLQGMSVPEMAAQLGMTDKSIYYILRK